MRPSKLLSILAVPAVLALGAAISPANAQAPGALPVSAVPQPPLDPALGISTIALWSGRAPGAKGDSPSDTPTLTLLRPKRPNGTAVIVAPGGAYINLATSFEGREPADRLAELGITAFVLKYRLGPNYLYPVPLEDARRAVRLVRSLAPTLGYSPDRIGMMGFSAGGHLSAMTAVAPEPGNPSAPDAVDRQSSALNFQILLYPWLNAMEPQVPDPKNPGKLLINYCSVTHGLTQADCARLNPQYTPSSHVSAATPPAFIAASTDDGLVPVTTSVAYYSAMHAAGADVELHLFDHGPHGFDLGDADPVLSQWPDLLTTWLRAHGWLTPTQPK